MFIDKEKSILMKELKMKIHRRAYTCQSLMLELIMNQVVNKAAPYVVNDNIVDDVKI